MGSGASKDPVLTRDNVDSVQAMILKMIEKNSILDKKFSKRNITDIYEIQASNRIGVGGTSIVVGCMEKATGRNFVCKIMTKRKISSTYLLLGSPVSEIVALIRKTTRNEVDTGLELKHPAIIETVDAFENNSGIFLVQEHCQGGELFEFVNKRQGITERMLHVVFSQILSALAYIHAKGIIHRDLKPENVLVQGYADAGDDVRNIEVKIIDFGMSKKLQTGKAKRRGTQVGSRMYVAPEIKFQGDDTAAQTSAVDMFSFGVLVYVMISGNFPFSDAKYHEMCNDDQKIVLTFPDGPSEWDNVDSHAKDFVQKLIQFRPEDRMTATQALGHPYITSKTTKKLNRLKSVSRQGSVENKLLNKRISMRKSFATSPKANSWSGDIVETLDGLNNSSIKKSGSHHY